MPPDSSAATAKAQTAMLVCRKRFNERSLSPSCSNIRARHRSGRRLRSDSGLDEFEDELVLGLWRVGRVLVARVRRIAHEIAFFGQPEPCRFDLLAQKRF